MAGVRNGQHPLGTRVLTCPVWKPGCLLPASPGRNLTEDSHKTSLKEQDSDCLPLLRRISVLATPPQPPTTARWSPRLPNSHQIEAHELGIATRGGGMSYEAAETAPCRWKPRHSIFSHDTCLSPSRPAKLLARSSATVCHRVRWFIIGTQTSNHAAFYS